MRFAMLLFVAASGAAQAECQVQADALPPVLELYTSEGCNSCPPADRWLSTLREKPIAAVPLAFHVDYWDELGWKDRFASPVFTQRQSLRVSAAGGKVVVTPQVMLGDRTTVDWRQRSAVSAAAKRQVLAADGLHATLGARRDGDDLLVSFAARGLPAAGWHVEFVPYRDGESSEVTAGENRKLTLHHDRVASAIFGPAALDTAASRPQRLRDAGGASGLVAIVNRDAGPGTGWALDLPLGACAD